MPRQILVTLAALSCLGCRSETVETGPVEPWRRDEVALSRGVRTAIGFRAPARQTLAFEVKAKEGTLRGRVPLEAAEVHFDPDAIDLTRGTLTFDLSMLSIDGPGEDAALAAPEDARENEALTQAARLWLGLGTGVSREERNKRQSAVFRIRSLREVSSHRALGGRPVRVSGSAVSRRVLGVVEGDLSIGGREVRHVLPVEIDFHYDASPGDGAIPVALDVRLREIDRIPFVEHGIEPRDERGHAIAERRATFGPASRLHARLSGQLRLSH